MRDRNRVAMWVLGVIGLLILAGGLAFMVYDKRQVAEAQDWPSVAGRIVSAQVDSERSYRNGRHRTRYVPRVQYSYVVGGATYSNDAIWLTSSHSYSSQSSAAAVIRDYAVGGTVQVFYAPADPARSALRREGNTALWVVLILVGLALLGGAWFIRWRRG